MGSFQAFRGHPVVETKGFLDKKTPRDRWAKLPVKQWGFFGFKELLPLEIHGFPALDLEHGNLPREWSSKHAPCTIIVGLQPEVPKLGLWKLNQRNWNRKITTFCHHNKIRGANEEPKALPNDMEWQVPFRQGCGCFSPFGKRSLTFLKGRLWPPLNLAYWAAKNPCVACDVASNQSREPCQVLQEHCDFHAVASAQDKDVQPTTNFYSTTSLGCAPCHWAAKNGPGKQIAKP